MKTPPSRRHFFDTALGTCCLEYSGVGLTRVHLPGRLRRDKEASRPPACVRRAAEALTRHLAGKPHDYKDIPLDETDLSDFARAVYAELREVPPTSHITYGELARRIGKPKAARAVGRAVGANPWPLIVPCHRVLPAAGGSGGFSAPGGVATKRKLLAIEGIRLHDRA